MVARDEPPDVDATLPATASWDDEDLPQPREREWSRLRPLRRPLLVLALAAALGAGGWKLATLKGSGVAVADETPSPTVSSSPRPGDLAGAGIQVRIPNLHRDGTLFSEEGPACPAEASCTTSSRVPAEVMAAVRAAFPGAKLLASQTVTVHAANGNHPLSRAVNAAHGNRLLSRTLHAAVGELDITVQLVARTLLADSGRVVSGADALVYTQRSADGYTARVSVVGPADAPRVVADADQLVGDERLLVLT